MVKQWRLKSLLLVVIPLGVSIFGTSTAYAGYSDWSQVPDKNKPYIKAFYQALVDEGLSKEAAAAMTARGGSESGFDPYRLEAGGSSWGERLKAPEYNSPPAYGFLQMQDRSAGGRLGKMLKSVETGDGGKGTKDPVVASKWEAKAIVKEFDEHDAFKLYTAKPSGAGFVISSTGTSYAGVSQKEVNFKESELIDSWDKFKKSTNIKYMVVAWTMSTVRPSGSALASTYKSDIKMAEAIYKEYSGLTPNSSSDSDGGEGSDSVSGTLATWDEGAIPNMPTHRDYGSEDGTFKDKLPTTDDLSGDEKAQIATWKEEREHNLASTSIHSVRVLLMVVGILFTLAPALLMTAWMTDIWLVFLDSPVLRFVTFNKLAVDYDKQGGTDMWFADKTRNKQLSTKRMGAGDLLIWSAIFTFFGVLLLTGYFYTAVGGFGQYLDDALGYLSQQ